MTNAYNVVTVIDGRFIAGESVTDVRPEVTSPEAGFEILSTLDWPDNREACWQLHLDTKHRLIRAELISIGSVDHTFMSARDIYRAALVAGASAIVIAHNHPSGDPEPSRDDEAVTRRLKQAGELIGVDLLDHLVLGSEGRWVSMARRGVV